METAELESKIYAALTADENIMELLNNRESSIFYLQAPSVYPNYPILVYSPISDVPVKHGDNFENAHRVTVRIHIIANVDVCPNIYSELKRIMSELGFTRLQTTPFVDEGGKYMLIADFKIILGA